jgi:hypothetical protein
MNGYEYIVNDIDFSFLTKIKNAIIAMKNRKRVFLEFCAKCGIDLPIDRDHKYRMPSKYIIHIDRVTEIFAIRDKVIASLYEQYSAKQELVNNEIITLDRKIARQKEFLGEEKKHLEKYKKSLEKTADPQEQIHLQSVIELATVKISQQSDVLDNLEDSKNSFLGIGAENRAKWSRQISIIEEATGAMISTFMNSVAKKIVKELGFTDYAYVEVDYSDEIKKKVKGE